jgi:hypothetical protein
VIVDALISAESRCPSPPKRFAQVGVYPLETKTQFAPDCFKEPVLSIENLRIQYQLRFFHTISCDD